MESNLIIAILIVLSLAIMLWWFTSRVQKLKIQLQALIIEKAEIAQKDQFIQITEMQNKY